MGAMGAMGVKIQGPRTLAISGSTGPFVYARPFHPETLGFRGGTGDMSFGSLGTYFF